MTYPETRQEKNALDRYITGDYGEKQFKHYPDDNGRKPLPIGKNFGRISLDMVGIFMPDKEGNFLFSHRSKGHNPEAFLDLEQPHPTFNTMKTTQLHIGIRGLFVKQPVYSRDMKKDRIDIFIELSELDKLITALRNIRGSI